MNDNELENLELSDFSIGEIFVNSKGDKGEKGDKGDKGERGEKGDMGERGADGAMGLRGLKGERGEQGEPGIPGKDGKDADVEQFRLLIKEGVQSFTPKIPTIEEIIAEIKDKKLIDISEIRNSQPFRKKKLDMDDMRWHGGGISANAIYVETPSGAVNSVNTTYTVVHNIQAVINFSLNGTFIHPSDYTFTSNIITFLAPLNIALTGLPFTVTYV